MSNGNSFSFRLTNSLLLVILAASLVFAQAVKQTPAPVVAAAAAPEQVRFLAPGEVTQLRLEVFTLSGAQLYDSDFKAGNLFDWNLQAQQGQRLPEGTYRCLLTVKDVTGRVGQRQGVLLVQAGEVAWQPPEQAESTLRTTKPLNATEQIEFLAIAPSEASLAATALAHNGSEGWLMTGTGALSVRTGNFYMGQEQEQMRLTADGKLGLGISEPQAKLDVAGQIRTSEGIVFPDGSVQTTAYVASGRSLSERSRVKRDVQGLLLSEADDKTAAEASSSLAPSISGSGTTNRITKWMDGPNGVVGDSIITEVGGNIGIGTGTTPPGHKLTVSGGDIRIDNNRYYRARDAAGFDINVFGLDSNNNAQFVAGLGGDFKVAPNAGTQGFQFTIKSTSGNVGIGTTTPGAKLSVDGAPATVDIETAEIMRLARPSVLGVKNTNSAGLSVGSFEEGITGRARLDVKLSGAPTVSNVYGAIPEVNVMSLLANGKVGIGTWTPTDTLQVIDPSGTTASIRIGPDLAGHHIKRVAFGDSACTGGDCVYIGEEDADDRLILRAGLFRFKTGNVQPEGDAVQSLGGAFNRWNTVFASNGTINTSDARLKQKVANLNYGLREVLQLRPVSFEWKDHSDGRTHLGLLAQETERLIPEVVVRDKDPAAPLGLSYADLIPVVIKAIQEQQTALEQKEAIIKLFKADNAALQQSNAELDVRLTALEQTLQQLLSQQPVKRQQ
jgi:hypothetical protein